MEDAAAKAAEKAERILRAVPGRTKELHIERIPDSGLWQITWTNGGVVPLALQGAFTSSEAAQRAITRWHK